VKTQIAHLSDLHVLCTDHTWRTRFVSFGRSLDPEGRARKVLAAIAAARARGADHFVFTGDLTELGTDAQFEALAEMLLASGVDPERITLLPGNHDAYTTEGAFRRALDGPLAPFRRASSDVVDLGAAVVLPLDVACHQPIGRAAGELTSADAAALERRLRDLSGGGRRIVVAMHHPPLPHANPAWQWIDGLRNHARLVALLERFEDVMVLHGHLHYPIERRIGRPREPRVFGTTATVEDLDGEPRVALYDVEESPARLVRPRAA